MKEEDKKFFSAEMHTLADEFLRMTDAFYKVPQDRVPEEDPDLLKMRDNYLQHADRLYKAFEKAGYDDREWNELAETSGVKNKVETALRKCPY